MDLLQDLLRCIERDLFWKILLGSEGDWSKLMIPMDSKNVEKDFATHEIHGPVILSRFSPLF